MNFKTSAPQTVTVKITKPRERARIKEIPVPKTLFTRRFSAPGTAFDYQCPKVLAVLSPEWLCSSLVAWQQVPVSQNKNCAWYDQYFLKHFDASLPNLASKRYTAHLFDRTATYAKFYIRHGDPRFLLAAIQAEGFYLQQIKPDGIFKLKRKPDYKYSLNEGSAILYMLTGDPRYKKVIERLLKPWAKWDRESNPTQNYTPGVYLWTERHHGFGMVSYLHAFEITGQQNYLNQAKGYFDTVLAMQISPADKKPPDGAWRHLAKDHGDGNGWATSPWMSAFLVDAIWKYWMLSDDARAPASLALYAKFTSEHSISPDGEKVYYMANSPDCGKSIGAEINHNMEGIYHLALGYYLSEGKDKKMLHQITTLIPPLLTKDPNDPRRKFNWTFRETSMAIWFLENARNHEQR